MIFFMVYSYDFYSNICTPNWFLDPHIFDVVCNSKFNYQPTGSAWNTLLKTWKRSISILRDFWQFVVILYGIIRALKKKNLKLSERILQKMHFSFVPPSFFSKRNFKGLWYHIVLHNISLSNIVSFTITAWWRSGKALL